MFKYVCGSCPNLRPSTMTTDEKQPTEKDGIGAIKKVMLKHLEDKYWEPFLSRFGLSDEDVADRLIRLVVLHIAIDRVLTALLAMRLYNASPESFSEVEDELATVPMGKRINLARASRLISDTCQKNIHVLNGVRNRFAHYHPKEGWGLGHIEELSSKDAFGKCADKAKKALDELFAAATSLGEKK